MLDKPAGPLRQRMIEDMTARRYKEKVQEDYVRHVRRFAAFLGRSPDTGTSEDLRRFQLHMAEQQFGAPTINAAIAALRFFFNVTLERPDLVRPLTTMHKPRKAPVVLSPEEVAHLIEAAPGLKYKAVLGVAYGAGLRVSEVVALKVSDIDSQRMTLYHMWTAPACKGFLSRLGDLVGCGHMSGPSSRRIWPLALMEFADWIPIKTAR